MHSCGKDGEEHRTDKSPLSRELEQLRRAGVVITSDSVIAAASPTTSSNRTAIHNAGSVAARGRFVAAGGAQFARGTDFDEAVESLRGLLSGSRHSEAAVDEAVELWTLLEPSLGEEERRHLWPLLLRHLGEADTRIAPSRGFGRQGGGR